MNIKITDESINLQKTEAGWSFKIKDIKVENIPTKGKAIERAEEIMQFLINQTKNERI